MRRLAFALVALFAVTGLALATPENFERSVRNILISEGGARCTNDPNDPGGPTKYGITIADVRAYIKKNASTRDVCAITEGQAIRVYHEQYWRHECVQGDRLPVGLDYSIMDYAVHAGPGRPGKKLRSHLGLNSALCRIDEAVLARIRERDLSQLIARVWQERLAFLRQLPHWHHYARGWTNRVLAGERIAHRMASPVFNFMLEPAEFIPSFSLSEGGKAYSQEE